MAKRHTNRCSTLSVMRETQIKPTCGPAPKTAWYTAQTRDLEQLRAPSLWWGCTSAAAQANSWPSLAKVKHTHVHHPNQRKTCVQRNLCVNVHHSSTHSPHSLETIRRPQRLGGPVDETPTLQMPAAWTQVQDVEPGAGGGLAANGEHEGNLGGGPAQCCCPTPPERTQFRKVPCSSGHLISSQGQGVRVSSARQETPSLVGVAQGPRHGCEHKGPGLSPPWRQDSPETAGECGPRWPQAQDGAWHSNRAAGCVRWLLPL